MIRDPRIKKLQAVFKKHRDNGSLPLRTLECTFYAESSLKPFFMALSKKGIVEAVHLENYTLEELMNIYPLGFFSKGILKRYIKRGDLSIKGDM